MTNIIQKVRRFLKDSSGGTSVVFALSSVPMLMLVGVALDMNRISGSHAKLQLVADKSALAAASTVGTVNERIAIATLHINSEQNVGPGVTVTPNVAATANDATVTLTGDMQGTFMKVAAALGGYQLGQTKIPVQAKAVNNLVPGYNVCVFSTDEAAAQAIYLYGTGAFSAVGCHLYSNSTSAGAITVQGNKTVISAGMHALGTYVKVGGAGSVTGSFIQETVTMDNPFDITVDEDDDDGAVSANVGNAGASLAAKVYNNIDIKKGTATFTPGVHYVTGEIKVAAGGKLVGNGVTIVLVGLNARLNIQAQGALDITAPRKNQLPADEQQFAGFAVYGYTNAADGEATYANTLLGGAGSNIRGIFYTPNQDLEIGGGSDFNVDSEYSPLIGKTITVSGNGAVTIKMDYEAYGFEKPEPLYFAEYTEVRLVQ